MPRKLYRLTRINHISVILLGIFIFVSFLPLSEANTPVWSYHIGGITAAAMSRNGDYIIVGTQEGHFYVFDRIGNAIKGAYVESKITTIDISDNGTAFVGTDRGYYFSTMEDERPKRVETQECCLSVSISDKAEVTIVGIERQTYIFDTFRFTEENYTLFDKALPGEEKHEGGFTFTDISSSGEVAVAATQSVIVSHHRETEDWPGFRFEDNITSLAISGNGQTFACGTEEGDIFSFVSKYPDKVFLIYSGDESINDLKITEDGSYIAYGTNDGSIGFIGKYGTWQWERQLMESIKSLSISDDGNLIAAVGETLCILDGSGKTLQKTAFPEPLQKLFLSEDGQYLFCVSTESILFYELSDNPVRLTKEYVYPSRRTFPPLNAPIRKKHRLEKINNWRDIQVGDINGDGENEFVIVFDDSIAIADKYGKILSEIGFSIEPKLRGLLDVTGDGIPEIITGHDDGRMVFNAYDENGTLLAHNEFYTQLELPLGGLCDIHPLIASDVDHDGKIEVVCFIESGYEVQPRGIYVFEYPSFEEEWYYMYAPSVETPTVIDLDGDDNLEVVLGSNASCDQVKVGNTDGCHTYVAVIDSQGEQLWIKEVGHGFTKVWVDVADLDEDGENEIVCGGWSFDNTWGSLFILDKDGEYVRGEDNVFEHSLFLGAVADLDSDGKKEILTFSSGGNICIYDYLLNLKKEKKVEINMGRFTRAIINDIDADDNKEIILYSNDESVYILSSELEVEWSESFPESPHVRVLITNLYACKNDLIILGNKIHVYSYQWDDDPEALCPLWVIIERKLLEEGTSDMKKGISLFNAGEYRASMPYLKSAKEKFGKLRNKENVESLSEKIAIASEKVFEENVFIGTILVAVFDGFLCVFLVCYQIFRKKWSRVGERALLLSLPLLLGLFKVYQVDEEYLQAFIAYAVPSLLVSIVIILRLNILGFVRTLMFIVSGHKNLLVLSIAKSGVSYRVSVESIREQFRPVKESKRVVFPSERKEELIKKSEFMVGVLSQYSSESIERSLARVKEILRETGTVIYNCFIPEGFFNILKAKFLLLEMEDTEIPWELMYSDNFFALKYAISRRIVATESVNIRKRRNNEKKALIISDPTETLPGAKYECEIIYERLERKMKVVFIEGRDANMDRIMYYFGQGFDIIHFAGHVDNALILSDSAMTPEDVKEYIVGTPVVVVNGCKSEELARAFLLGGAMAYVGTIHPIHDRSTAEFAADFYNLCLQYPIGEALRRARENHVDKDLVWASSVMYGDPTLKLL
ncbi:MAG: hypothetical protein AYK18_15130 [Theionarchaea archaeon DG-70]|nr:MAG: hypothetical protein AYK18_15130 [Theionarchaea archaeon DG-70]